MTIFSSLASSDSCFADQEPPLKFGETLVARSLLTGDQLQIALHEQRRTRETLGSLLIRLGFVGEADVLAVLAEKTGLPPVDLNTYTLDPTLLRRLPPDVALRCRALLLRETPRSIDVALCDPFDIVALDEIRTNLPDTLEIIPRVASPHAIEEKIQNFYGSKDSVLSIADELETSPHLSTSDTAHHPTVRMIDLLLDEAIERGASDIHFEPENGFLRVRIRVNGSLRKLNDFHIAHWKGMAQRLKILAGMNIADARSIQDGRLSREYHGRTIDFRVASMPTVSGETIAVRLLDHRRAVLPLHALGYNDSALNNLRRIIHKPHGLTLLTGPTGSGKTTSLYALLQTLNKPDVHIATLEDPVEYQIEGLRQTSIQEESGMGFADGVRGLLRMDPDILLIGEIRDSETAQMALRAAMTGHQVYATLHCNDVFSAIPRLIDLGLTPRLLAGNISGIVAQRLVRTLCPLCRQCHIPSKDEASVLDAHGLYEESCVVWTSHGCSSCEKTGSQGRTIIAEVLSFSPALDNLVSQEAPRAAFLEEARKTGFESLQKDGLHKVLDGQISLSDLARAADLSRGNEP